MRKYYYVTGDAMSAMTDGLVFTALVFGLGFWFGAKWKAKKEKEKEATE